MNSFDKSKVCDLVVKYGIRQWKKGNTMGSNNWEVEEILRMDEKAREIYDEILEILYPTDKI